MPIVRDGIIKWHEPTFKGYKKSSIEKLKEQNPALLKSYQEYEGINRLLGDVQYWHGTGRFQYSKLGMSKYDGASKTETVDILEKIISDGGLYPQYDPWFERYVKTPYSLSLANQWFYGKMYSHYHQDEKTDLAYEIAPISFWFKVFISVQFTERWGKIIPAFVILYLFSNKLQNQAKKWLSTFRSDTDKKWPFWKILTSKSDIKNNYPILFAVKKDVKTFPIMKLARFFEVRTPNPVRFNDVAFISVPINQVEETRKILSLNKIDTTVVPLEYLELYMTKYSLKQIVYGSLD